MNLGQGFSSHEIDPGPLQAIKQPDIQLRKRVYVDSVGHSLVSHTSNCLAPNYDRPPL